MAMVGEGRHNEAVVPLPDLSHLAKEAGAAGAAVSGDGGGRTEININGDINASGYQEGKAAGRGLKDALRSANFD